MEQSIPQSDAAAIQEVVARMLAATQDDQALQLLAGTVLVSAVGLYAAEKDRGGAIQTFGDALWSVWSTVCTVGDSGCPPVTPAGRLIESVLMLVGHPLYDQTKGKIGQLLNALTGRPSPSEQAVAEKELLAKLDLLLERLQATNPAAPAADPTAP